MSAPESLTTDSTGRASGGDLAYDQQSALQADVAALSPTVRQARLVRPPCRGPFTHCGMFLDTNNATCISENDAPCNTNASPYRSSKLEAQSACSLPTKANDEVRAIPYNVAVGFACRPNGLPLSTIIEKGSHSTLRSRGSVLTVTCRYPHLHTCNSNPLAFPDQEHSEALGHTRVQRIQEHSNAGHVEEEKIDDLASPNMGSTMRCSGYSPSVPIKVESGRSQPPEAFSTQEVGDDTESRGLKGLLRGVLQHVRGASRRSESRFSVPASPLAERSARGNAASEGSTLPATRPSDKSLDVEAHRRSCCITSYTDYPQFPSEDSSQPSPEDSQRSLYNGNLPVHDACTICHVLTDKTKPSDKLEMHQGLVTPPSLKSSIPNQAQTSNQPVSSGSEGAEMYVESGATGRHSSSRALSATYTLDSTPIYRSSAPSLDDVDLAGEASFYETSSTSYSGTVLGIDLDLQHEFASSTAAPVRLCRTPPNTSQRNTEARIQASMHSPPRSVISSALPILLPLAAASGIVQLNNATPRMSFYSPSGNLIQAEHSSNSSTPTTSYYRNALSVSERPARPAAVPLTTPPHSSIPLPGHIKPRRQQHHHTRSHIVPKTVATSSSVKGCDGFIRKNSITPRSGVRRPPTSGKKPSDPRRQSKHIQSSSNTGTAKSRFRAVASCVSLQTGGRVQKSKRNNPRLYAKSRARLSEAEAPGLGPLVGRTLRVCFCQPWDVVWDRDGAAEPRSAGRERGRGDGGCGCLGEAAQCHDHAQPSPEEVAQDPPARIVNRRGRGG
jgi:hypothetical protein